MKAKKKKEGVVGSVAARQESVYADSDSTSRTSWCFRQPIPGVSIK